MAFVSREVLSVNNQIVVCIKLPELAIDDIKVFIGEEIGDLVDVWLILQQSQDLEKIATTQLTGCDATIPVAIHNIEDATDHLREREMKEWQGMTCMYLCI